MIDLKQTSGLGMESPHASQQEFYPTLYISGIKDVDLKIDQPVKLEGRVKTITKRKDGDGVKYACDIEVTSLDDGKKADRKKTYSEKSMDDSSAIDEGLEKEMDETETNKKTEKE